MELEHWNEFYRVFERPSHSDFAEYIFNHFLKRGDSIMDLGCGDGIDSIYFMKMGLNVTAVDQTIPQSFINKFYKDITIAKSDAILFLNKLKGKYFNHIFARFFLHAIDDLEEDLILPLIYKRLCKNGYLHIETRTLSSLEMAPVFNNQKRSIMQYDGHYRRFVPPEAIRTKLEINKFKIVYMKEDYGFSSLNPQDKLMRITCKKV